MNDYENVREVAALFEANVPEYANGEIRIVTIAREPGVRTKVSVASDNPSIDPVGACVGEQGGRIMAVVAGLDGEKIDIVPWDENDVRFVCNAIAPAPVKRVFVDDANRLMELVVPDDSVDLALGPNIRLAARLTGWRLDVIRESRHEAMLQRVRDLAGEHGEALISSGYTAVEWIAAATVADLTEFAGLDAAVAAPLIERAKALTSGA